MLISVQHQISNPATFWGIAKEATAQLPDGITLHYGLPNADGSEAVCLWEADSVDTVRGLIEDNLGHVSTNQYFAVDAKNAMGASLPKV